MRRLTFKKPNGEWGLNNFDIKKVPSELYGAICKLRDYEETGLNPAEVQPTAYAVDKVVERINKKIEFAEKQIVKNPADKIDEIVNNAAEDFIEAYKECIEIIRGGGAEC